MSSLEDYLGSEQAREDVRVLLSRQPWSLEGDKSYTTDDGACWADDSTEAWRCVCLYFADLDTMSVYYRPDSDRFIVSDLGEGVRAYRLRTGDSAPTFYHVRGNLGPSIGFAEGGTLSAVLAPTAEELPDALCRVLLASHRVANLGAERSGDE